MTPEVNVPMAADREERPHHVQLTNTEALFLTTRKAADYLGCSKDELLKWIKPDRRLPGEVGAHTGARLWLRPTLDSAKPHLKVWRERDFAARAAQAAAAAAVRDQAKARRAGMRKGGALLIAKACALLECSRTELNRWAADGRLPPDGEIVLSGLAKSVNARAWLPQSLERAQSSLAGWRAQDQTKKLFNRRGLRSIPQKAAPGSPRPPHLKQSNTLIPGSSMKNLSKPKSALKPRPDDAGGGRPNFGVIEIWQVDFFDKENIAQSSWHETEADAQRHVQELKAQQSQLENVWSGPSEVLSLQVPLTRRALVEWLNDGFSDPDMRGNLPGWYTDAGQADDEH